MDGFEVEPEQPVEFVEGEMVDVSLLTGKAFATQDFPAAMQVVIERDGADEAATRMLLQSAMHFAHDNGRVGEMFEDLGHHDGVETRVAKAERGGEIERGAGDARRAGDFERVLIQVNADPVQPPDQVDHDAAAAPDIQAAACGIVALCSQLRAKEIGFDFLVLSTAGPISTAAGGFVVLFVEFSHEARSALWFVEEKFGREWRCGVHNCARLRALRSLPSFPRMLKRSGRFLWSTSRRALVRLRALLL